MSAKPADSMAGLPMVHVDAAGLDVGSTEICACVPMGRSREAVRRFGTFAPDLYALTD